MYVGEFPDLVNTLNLLQSVKYPTHSKGHILDVVHCSGFCLVDFINVFVSDYTMLFLKAPLSTASLFKTSPYHMISDFYC